MEYLGGEGENAGFLGFEGVPAFLPALEKVPLLFLFDIGFKVEIENCTLTRDI